ncbi:unnamed protein product [Toxocara canis]|uniref:ILEI domain-containing protein n=1 Tax=Toxocara canis TaxID=6265 RepID=A0A183U1G3_TOXCA|nr:unnamed protein product [Toxocara canis]
MIVLASFRTPGGQPASDLRDEIPMSFYTGVDKNDSPSLCVNDHLVYGISVMRDTGRRCLAAHSAGDLTLTGSTCANGFRRQSVSFVTGWLRSGEETITLLMNVIDRGVNDAGRGLNLVVVDSKTHRVTRCGHFDTYDQDSVGLVLFLEQLVPGEIVALVSFDEASAKLSDLARQIFYELGSSLIQNLRFRSSWYFVGQKGIDGYTPFEDLTMPSGSDWAKPINQKICIPSNHERLEQVLVPRALSDPSRASRAIFSVPILIIAGGHRFSSVHLQSVDKTSKAHRLLVKAYRSIKIAENNAVPFPRLTFFLPQYSTHYF